MLESLRLNSEDEFRIAITASSTASFAFQALWARNETDAPHIRLLGQVSHSSGDRTRETTSFASGGGFLYGLLAGSPAVKRGQIFVECQVGRRSLFISRCRGYVTASHGLQDGEFESSISGPGFIVTNEAASTLVNNTALTRTITVPTNARWRLYGGHVLQADDVSRVMEIRADSGVSGENLFEFLLTTVGANTRVAWPSTSAEIDVHNSMPVPLSEGDRINITFAAGGASAGGTARSSAVVEEWIEI